MGDLLYKELSYELIGVLFDVHNELGGGFLEVVYADAVEYEFKKRNIPYQREKKFLVNYKDTVLPHHFFADFVIDDKIILELKSASHLHETYFAQCLNYLKISKLKLAILANFEADKLIHHRIIL
ncbi:GxxExxY protein [Salinimicrobium soli]|uniref:GxxExxY protein n=1 Tax=Salinimicrobium soli TaxID=1254399 RepID=UPI003AAA3F0E